MARFFRRVLGAAAVLPDAYEEVEADPKALPQAMVVVALSSVASGIAFLPDQGLRGFGSAMAAAFLGWLIWAWLAYHIGTRWLPEPATEADWGQLLRTTGFAAAPGIVRILGVIPEAKHAILLLTTGWMLAAFVMAVRQALDYEHTWRAVVVCLAGAVIYVGFLFLLPEACQLSDGT